MTALKDEAERVCRGLRRKGRNFVRPLSGSALLKEIIRRRSLSAGTGIESVAHVDVAYVGPGSAGLADLGALLGSKRHRAVFFCGLAGGLSPGLCPGDIVSGLAVRSPGFPDLPAGKKLPFPGSFHSGVILSLGHLVCSPEEKGALAVSEGADAVDMESYGWMECANRAGVSAHVARVISDGAGDALPPEILGFVTRVGTISVRGILKGICGRPGILLELWAMRKSIRLAHARLEDLGGFLWCLAQSDLARAEN